MTSHHRKGHQKETWSAMVSFTSSSLHVLPGLGWQRHVFAELHVPAARFRSGSGLQDCSGFRFTALRTRSCQCGLLTLRCVQTGRDASTAAFAVSAAPPLLAALAWGVQMYLVAQAIAGAAAGMPASEYAEADSPFASLHS